MSRGFARFVEMSIFILGWIILVLGIVSTFQMIGSLKDIEDAIVITERLEAALQLLVIYIVTSVGTWVTSTILYYLRKRNEMEEEKKELEFDIMLSLKNIAKSFTKEDSK
ncbi:hypothetical protein [Lachnospira multipara]|uniref:hypothetical protein n=1 Tax=Lachnospira multipara TaxID=28051 RepID=UPI0004E28801|nr:hypothetical protein [Lachnospira multipara]